MRKRFLLLIFFVTTGLSQAADFFFLQMSDPQFGMYTDNGEFSQETANFEFAIATANRLHPAFVVVCGDLINKPAEPAQAAEYLRIAGKLDKTIPLYSVAGNHDVGNEPTPKSLTAFREKFGRDYYSFRHEDFAGIVLNSSLIQHPARAPEEASKQETWLKAELGKLNRDGAHRVAVFQHIPFFLEKADEPDQYFNIPVEARRKFMELFDRSSMHYVFAGHYHRNSYGETSSLHMITTGPVGKPLGPDGSGIRVVVVRQASMDSQFYGLHNLPDQIKP